MAAASTAVVVAVLVVAVLAAARTRALGREYSGHLVPAAGAVDDLLRDFTQEQIAVHDYVDSGNRAQFSPYDVAVRQAPRTQGELGQLVHGYARMPALVGAAVVAEHAWRAQVAGPELAAAHRGDFASARVLQANYPRNNPYALTVRSRFTALQDAITAREQVVTAQLAGSQNLLIGTLVAACTLVVIVASGAVLTVRQSLLRPFASLRLAAESVATGDYATPMPIVGPPEVAELARAAEQMRTRLVRAIAEREGFEKGFRQLFEAAPDATLAVAEDGTITMANAEAGAMFGYPSAELIGKPVEMLVPAVARKRHARYREGYNARPVPRPMRSGLELSAMRRDGTEFPAEISLSTVPSDRGTVVVAAIRDTSERLAAEAERDRLRAEAQQERIERRLQQSERLESLGQLVGGVAHDFNNLLNVIIGYTDFASDQVGALADGDERLGPVLGDIRRVRDAADQAARLTRQLLTFARRDLVRPETLNLNEIVQSASHLLRRTLGEHIELTVTTEPGLWQVRADRGQIEQVLVNLAINARDAMPEGGKLTIDSRNVDVDAAYATSHPGLQPGRFVRLRVSDTGTGMDRATLDRVFEPFFTTKPKGHGTGLGLATVYGVITHAGGTVQLYSEPGMGTTVSALLPALEEAGARAATEAAASPTAGDLAGHGERVLLVEDEEVLREMTRRTLAGKGYEVTVASSGPEAVRLAGDPGLHLDLLLTDVVMPEMLGNEVAARVTQIRPGLPVLYMSGYAEPVLSSHGALGPTMAILEKPFTQTALLARVRDALGRGSGQARATETGTEHRDRHAAPGPPGSG